MKILRTIYVLVFLIFLFTIYENIMAFKDGIVGLTKKNGNEVGCVCHNFDPDTSVSVVINGPLNVRVLDTAIYTLRIANGTVIAGGCDISVSLGSVITSLIDTSLKRAESFPGSGFELTHKYPKLFISDTLTFTFKYVAPNIPNIRDTLFANGNSVDNDTTSEGDKWNYARNFIINVTPMSSAINNTNLSKSFELSQNYPNPFNPETKIQFNIIRSSDISLIVYDVNGREITKLIDNKFYNNGSYSLTFNAQQHNLASGVYFYKLITNDFSDVKKMVLVE